MGDIDDALSIMNVLLITFPDAAAFHHRISMLFSAKGDFEKAYEHAKKAASLDEKLYEATMRLVALEIRKGNTAEAIMLLDEIPNDIPSRKRIIRDTIKADVLLLSDKLDEARDIMRNRHFDDAYCSDVSARIELRDAVLLISKNNYILARENVQNGIDLAKAALKNYPNNYSLITTLEQLERLSEFLTKI